MADTTRDLLVTAAADLLDLGGQTAVTIRAVADRCGVSHNAPYKHFAGRQELLAVVAQRDFEQLRSWFETASLGSAGDARTSLLGALDQLIEYAHAHPARYRLLFSDQSLTPDDALVGAAFASFQAFRLLVSRYQREVGQAGLDDTELAGLIYATCHGAIDLHLGGRAADAKGLVSVENTIRVLFEALERPAQNP
ncbi:TetR/AcrR family transcriptional regulator [Herbiconiux sp.]|uniref:TetR/AcrR family transcriptional regulator n=1 Tax=Herbiconiux sp. TaxID=1871186 RepID=UPI0025C2D702|nr:TetR/AcrR family transcriptional regulator [Herbiconiux sp.]